MRNSSTSCTHGSAEQITVCNLRYPAWMKTQLSCLNTCDQHARRAEAYHPGGSMAHCVAACQCECTEPDRGRVETVGISSTCGSSITGGNFAGWCFIRACNQGKPSEVWRQLVPACPSMFTPRCCSHSLATERRGVSMPLFIHSRASPHRGYSCHQHDLHMQQPGKADATVLTRLFQPYLTSIHKDAN